jgi:DNA-binding NtrC family response regulator
MERTLLLTSKRTLDAADFAEPESVQLTDEQIPFPATMAAIARAAAQRMLTYCNGNKSDAARRLGISRPRLQRLLDATDNTVDLNHEAEVDS